MTQINNDVDFKQSLNALSLAEQRVLGARFVQNVMSLTDDDRIVRTLNIVLNKDVSKEELAAANQTIKGAIRDSFTRCGADGDWAGQAGYFVARAAAALVAPTMKAKGGPALQAAMHSRMAKTCDSIDAGDESEHQESEAQYEILSKQLRGETA